MVHFQADSAAEIATRKTPNDTKKKKKEKEKTKRERNKTKRKKKEERVGGEEKIPLFRRGNARVLARYSLISPLTNELPSTCARVYNSPSSSPPPTLLRTLNSDPETRRGRLCAWPSTTGPRAGYAIEPKNGRTRVSGTMG